MVESDREPRGEFRTRREPGPGRGARVGVVVAQIATVLIILVGMQYLLRKLADLVLNHGP